MCATTSVQERTFTSQGALLFENRAIRDSTAMLRGSFMESFSVSVHQFIIYGFYGSHLCRGISEVMLLGAGWQ